MAAATFPSFLALHKMWSKLIYMRSSFIWTSWLQYYQENLLSHSFPLEFIRCFTLNAILVFSFQLNICTLRVFGDKHGFTQVWKWFFRRGERKKGELIEVFKSVFHRYLLEDRGYMNELKYIGWLEFLIFLKVGFPEKERNWGKIEHKLQKSRYFRWFVRTIYWWWGKEMVNNWVAS